MAIVREDNRPECHYGLTIRVLIGPHKDLFAIHNEILP
jgi:hypothetical protein